MTAKCSLFVDAGYLLASSASRLTGTSLRSGIHVKYRRLVQGLIKAAEETTGLPVLRVHWYDSAKDGVPDRSQERIGELPKVKLRLGRFGYDGQQKGVDLRLGLDMVAHAHHKAADVFLLVSGDDDLTEAVEDVQVHGVQVLVLAVPGNDGQPHGVSRHLVRAADEIVTLDPEIIDSAIIPIETPEQAKDDAAEASPSPEVLLLTPHLDAGDLAQLADAIVFGNPALPIIPDAASAALLQPNQGELHVRELNLNDLPDGELRVTELQSSELTKGDIPRGDLPDGNLIDLNDIELLLNAAHLDEAHLNEAQLSAEVQADSHSDGAAPTSVANQHAESAPAEEAAHIAEHDGGVLLGSPGPNQPVRLPPAEILLPDGAGENVPSVQPESGAEAPQAESEAASAETSASKPEQSQATEPALVVDEPRATELSVVTETLTKLMKPTPRSVASNIGRPVERPLRPTYSTGPDTPKQGTWASQWSATIDSVVSRVLNSLTKSTTADHWNVISLGRPSIPQEIDKALLLDATEAMGVYTLSDAERHEVRAAFWREFDTVNR